MNMHHANFPECMELIIYTQTYFTVQMFVCSPNAIMISSNELTSEDHKMVDIKPETHDPITESNKRDEVKGTV